MEDIKIIHLINGSDNIVAYIEFSINDKTKILSVKTFETRYGDYKNYIKGKK